MELITYDTNTVSSKPKGLLTIRMNSKHGTIAISQELCRLMGVHEGSQVKFHQDKNEPENWFIERVQKDGFEVSGRTNQHGRNSGVQFRRREFVLKFYEQMHVKIESIVIRSSRVPTLVGDRKLYPLIIIGPTYET